MPSPRRGCARASLPAAVQRSVAMHRAWRLLCLPALACGLHLPVTLPALRRFSAAPAALPAVITEDDPLHLEEVLDRALHSGAREDNPIIMPFSPRGSWLWTRWHGTVLETTWKPTVLLMTVAALLVCLTYSQRAWTWPLLAVPDPANPVVMRLKALDTMWNYLLTLATFTSSFFVSQACEQHLREISSHRTLHKCTSAHDPLLRAAPLPLACMALTCARCLALSAVTSRRRSLLEARLYQRTDRAGPHQRPQHARHLIRRA